MYQPVRTVAALASGMEEQTGHTSHTLQELHTLRELALWCTRLARTTTDKLVRDAILNYGRELPDRAGSGAGAGEPQRRSETTAINGPRLTP